MLKGTIQTRNNILRKFKNLSTRSKDKSE